jgi:hypothetical protein
MPMHLKAGLPVFAGGVGFARYVRERQLRARLKVNHSAMVVAWPVFSTNNFARIQFSMLANSGFLEQDANEAEKATDLPSILTAAAPQTYLHIKSPLHLEGTAERPCNHTDLKNLQQAKQLAADSYPSQTLMATLTGEAVLASGSCDDLPVISSL